MTSVLKKPSQSPPPTEPSTSSTTDHSCCKCNLCIGRSVSPKQRNKRANDNDLEELVYALVVLITDGRVFDATQTEGVHANFLLQNITKKILKINQAAQGLGDSKFLTTGDKLSPYFDTICHECSNSENIQCRVATKLKLKLEKCVRDHLNTDETEPTLNQNHLNNCNSLSILKKVHHNYQRSQSPVHDSNDNKSASTTSNDRFTASTFNSLLTNKFSNCSGEVEAPLPITTTNIVVNVFLLPVCCFNELINVSGDILLDSDTSDYELLESWTISMITNQKNDQTKNKLLTFNQLFQAIRSYLHFSQISSWINQSKGKQPRNIAYSITYSTDKHSNSASNSLTEKLDQSQNRGFDFQTFPSLHFFLSSNKFYVNQQASSASQRSSISSTHLKVNLLSRKRSNNHQSIPNVNCPKDHHRKLNEIDFHETSKVTATPSNKSNVTQPISIVSSIKMAGKELSSEFCNVENPELNNKTYFLPHWTTVKNTTTISNTTTTNKASDNEDQKQDLSLKFSSLTPNQIPLVLSNLKQTPSSNTSLIDNAANNPITTPTSFPHSKLPFQHPFNTTDTSTVGAAAASTSSLLPPAHNQSNFLISQSPKVLVSNHQLLSDLCSVTQNQLSLTSNLDKVMGKSSDFLDSNSYTNESNLININKRKYFDEIDSETDQLFEKRYETDNECQFEPSTSSESSSATRSIKVTAQVSGDLQSRTTSLIIKSTEHDQSNINGFKTEKEQEESLLKNKHLAFVNNINKNKLIKPVQINNNNLLLNEQFILNNHAEYDEDVVSNSDVNNNELIPHSEEQSLRKLTKYSNINFTKSNLPLSSSPAPVRKSGSYLFDFDNSLKNPRSIRNALSNQKSETPDETLEASSNASTSTIDQTSEIIHSSSSSKSSNKPKRETKYEKNCQSLNSKLSFSTTTALYSMPLTPNCLLGSFEESLLNGRMNPVGVVDGFYAEIGASGSFFPEHATLPVHAAFYQVCEDIAASPYLGIINLGSMGKRGYKVPNKGTIQVTLFNPNNSVIKMFVVMYDLSDMPPGHRTFLRQRTMYVPLISNGSSSSKPVKSSNLENAEDFELKSYLRYLIHLRFATSKSGKMYLHTNIKLVFARNKCEIDPRLAKYEYKTFTEAPKNPRYSPRK